jgi:hypothetical protein
MNIFKKTKELNETITSAPEEEWIWVEGFKGTDKDMCCRDYQYELGKQYDIPKGEKVALCESGFHFCLSLKDVFGYYKIGNGNRFFKVKARVRKTDNDKYGHYGYNGRRYICYDKLAAKSIIFLSELTADEIFKDTEIENIPAEHQQMAIDISLAHALRQYQKDTLINDGYSEVFASHILDEKKFDVAHALGSQKDLSMDVKVWAIFH